MFSLNLAYLTATSPGMGLQDSDVVKNEQLLEIYLLEKLLLLLIKLARKKMLSLLKLKKLKKMIHQTKMNQLEKL